MGPITLNPPASVHAGALATETVLSASSAQLHSSCNCAEDDKCKNTEPMVIALDTKDGHAWTCGRRVCSNQTLSSWEFVQSLIGFQ